MSSWKVLESDKAELVLLGIREAWKRKFPGHFYLTRKGNEVFIVTEKRMRLHDRDYLVNVKGKLNVQHGVVIYTNVPKDIPLYIRKKDNFWIVERFHEGELLWSKEFQESEVSATYIGNLVFVSGIDKGRSCAYVISSDDGKLLWSLEKDFSADFFVTSVRAPTSSSIEAVSVTWLNGLNNVSISQGGRLVFLEAISDPFYEVEGEEKAVKDELYAIDSLDGSILWRESHDLIETKETPKGVIVETLDSQGEVEKCIVKFVTNDGTIAWLREYGSYVRIFNINDIVALESDSTIEIVNLTSGKRTLLLSGSKRAGASLGKLLKDKVIVEEYKPAKGKHSLKAFDLGGRLLWEVYLSPESSTIIDFSDDRFGAIYVRGYVYLVDLSDGKVMKVARTGKVVALFLKYPFIVTARRGSPNTRIYDVLSGTIAFEFNEILRSEDIVPLDEHVLVQLENTLYSYIVKRDYITCTYPRSISCQRGSSLKIRYDFMRTDRPVRLTFRKVPFIDQIERKLEIRKPNSVTLELTVPNDVSPGLYELVASMEAEKLSRKLVTQLMIH